MVVNLQGGLGNQIFQYAYGHARGAQYNSVLLRIGNPPRTLGLSAWVDVPLTEEYGVSGYWQSEKWFDGPTVRKMFSMPRGPVPMALRFLAHQMEGQAFLGVRRGDYLWPERIGFHGVLPLSYYQQALQALPAGVKVFLFSDDLDWTTRNIEGQPVDINGPEEKHWDIWLMSLCRYAIIANSSFHWWGAWLGQEKQVIAPKNWFAVPVPGAEDIVPERWLTL